MAIVEVSSAKIRTFCRSGSYIRTCLMMNEIKVKHKTYYLQSGNDSYHLKNIEGTPFFHHVALLHELKRVSDNGPIYTYHFNGLRTVLEKAVSFFGLSRINDVIHGFNDSEDDRILFARAVQLLSHGGYDVFSPAQMTVDNQELFTRILNGFMNKYFPKIIEAIEKEAEAEANTQPTP